MEETLPLQWALGVFNLPMMPTMNLLAHDSRSARETISPENSGSESAESEQILIWVPPRQALTSIPPLGRFADTAVFTDGRPGGQPCARQVYWRRVSNSSRSPGLSLSRFGNSCHSSNFFTNAIQYNINLTFICTEKPKNSRDSLYCTVCFIAVAWDPTYDTSEVCLCR